MCGINLIIDKNKLLNSGPINKMSELTFHRGPDETKVIIEESTINTFHLSANRLKITDQNDISAQPFIVRSQKQALLFNGEIYNYYELKNELLRKNIVFNSESDTEVLFHWIREFGKGGLEQLEGMFAFIFINFEKEDTLIVRDRFGIKPIYYFDNDNYFIASSEIKSIIGSGLIKKELNTHQFHHYLSYKYVKPPETFYKNVYELKHAHSLYIQKNKRFLSSFFINKNKAGNSSPIIEEIEELITNSLLQQLDAQVPLGLLLSGGIDSTLLLALAHKEGYSLPTFSIVNSSKEKSFGTKDYYYSRKASSLYASNHHEIEVDIGLLDQFDDFIDKMDQPIGDSAYFMTSEICKHASKSMKILLSGAGADEFFGGYNRHLAYYNYLKHRKSIELLDPIIKTISNNLPTGFAHPLRKQFRLAKKWGSSIDSSPLTTYNNYLTFRELNIGLSHINEKDIVNDWFGWALYNDQNNYLVSDVLALSDKASMLHGIELRVPYLNEQLAAYLETFSPESRIKYGQKWILKDILEKYGGKKFNNRSKEGFGLPLSNWLFNKKANFLWEIFEPNHIIFDFLDKGRFDKIVDQQKRNNEDHGPLLWSILVLAHWVQRNF